MGVSKLHHRHSTVRAPQTAPHAGHAGYNLDDEDSYGDSSMRPGTTARSHSTSTHNDPSMGVQGRRGSWTEAEELAHTASLTAKTFANAQKRFMLQRPPPSTARGGRNTTLKGEDWSEEPGQRTRTAQTARTHSTKRTDTAEGDLYDHSGAGSKKKRKQKKSKTARRQVEEGHGSKEGGNEHDGRPYSYAAHRQLLEDSNLIKHMRRDF